MSKQNVKVGRLNGSDFLVIPSMENLKSRTQIISMVQMNKDQKFIDLSSIFLEKFNKEYHLELSIKDSQKLKALLLQDLEEERQSLSYFIEVDERIHSQISFEIDEFTKCFKVSFIIFVEKEKEENE